MIRIFIFIWFFLPIDFFVLAQEVNLERGLVSYYPFTENANDAVGTNHGQVFGATHQNGRCGDMAYSFNGFENYIDCGNDRSLNGNWTGLTLAVWVRPGEIVEQHLATIMAKWAFNPERDHFGIWLNSSYRVIMAVSAPGTMENGIFSNSSLKYDTWQHIVCTWEASGDIRIYIDGKFDKSGKQTGRGINVRSPITLKFGRQQATYSRAYKGWIDEARIYRRVLNDREIRVLYEQGRAVCEKVYVKGRVLNKNTGLPVQAEVVFEDMLDGSVFGKTNTQGDNAEYEMIVPFNKRFGFFADAENYLSENENINTTNMALNQVIERDLYVVPLEVGQSIRLNNIFFDFAKFSLREESWLELDRIVPYFKKFPNLKIELSGHTDSVGSDEANQKLSENRANAVREYLVKKGVPPSKVVSVGFGESMPVASNDTDDGRQLNRRVEFKVLEK